MCLFDALDSSPFNVQDNCLTQLYAKDITPDEKQELDEALQREVICLDILVY